MPKHTINKIKIPRSSRRLLGSFHGLDPQWDNLDSELNFLEFDFLLGGSWCVVHLCGVAVIRLDLLGSIERRGFLLRTHR